MEECRHLWGGSEGKDVFEKMQHWKSWCQDFVALNLEEVSGVVEALKIVVVRGFASHVDLGFVLPMEFDIWTQKSRTRASLKRVSLAAQENPTKRYS